MPLDDFTVNQGGWDPWWFTPAKKNSSDPNQAILWACLDGKIWRSTDGGTSWLDVTPGDDPPNDWGDGTAPTVADLTFIQRTDNIHQNKAHYFITEWQEAGGDWRGWLLVTEDDGVTWEWISLKDGTTQTIDDGTYYYASSFYEHTTYENAQKRIDLYNSGNVVGEDDGAVATFEHYWKAGGGFLAAHVWKVDMGGSLTGNNMTIEVKSSVDNAPPFVNPNATNPPGPDTCDNGWWHTGTWSVYVSNDDIVYNLCAGGGVWGREVVGLDWGNVHTYAAAPGTFRYIRFTSPPNFEAGDEHLIEMYVDAIRVANVSSASGGGDYGEIRPIWMDTDSEDGSRLYITAWADDDQLHLWIFDTTNLTGTATDISLGTCTIAQLNAKTYIAYPYTPPFNGDYVYVFGRMNAPQGLANPEHLIVTTDGGTSWASLENGFGADYIGAFRAEGSTDASRTFYAVRNIAASPAKLYVGLETLTYRIDTSFTAGVYVDALTVSPSGQVAVGSDATNDIEIIAAPWASWTDITGSYPGSNVRSLTYI